MGRGGCGWWHIGSPGCLALPERVPELWRLSIWMNWAEWGTAGMISTYWYGFRNGYTAEVDKALGTKESWNQIQKSEWLRQQILKSGAELWFASFGCGTVTKGNQVVGVVVAPLAVESFGPTWLSMARATQILPQLPMQIRITAFQNTEIYPCRYPIMHPGKLGGGHTQL